MTEDKEPILMGRKVIVRDLIRRDVDAMTRWPHFKEPDFHWANLAVATVGERDAYFERGRTNSTRKRFAVFSHTGRLIGTIGLRNIDFSRGEGTLGIIIRADEVGRGYGGDAVRCFLRYAFDSLGLQAVLLDVAHSNARARRCYESVGFVETGQHLDLGGTIYIDMKITQPGFALVDQRQPVGRA